MSTTKNYGFNTIPQNTPMTFGEFRALLAGEKNSNFTKLDEILSKLEIESAYISDEKFIIKKKNGEEISVPMDNVAGRVTQEGIIEALGYVPADAMALSDLEYAVALQPLVIETTFDGPTLQLGYQAQMIIDYSAKGEVIIVAPSRDFNGIEGRILIAKFIRYPYFVGTIYTGSISDGIQVVDPIDCLVSLADGESSTGIIIPCRNNDAEDNASVFWVTPNITAFSEIESALSENRTCMIQEDGEYYRLAFSPPKVPDAFVFVNTPGGFDSSSSYYLLNSSGEWIKSQSVMLTDKFIDANISEEGKVLSDTRVPSSKAVVEAIQKYISVLTPVTEESIKEALGYIPADKYEITELEDALRMYNNLVALSPVIITGVAYEDRVVFSNEYSPESLDEISARREILFFGLNDEDDCLVISKYIAGFGAVGSLYTIDETDESVYSSDCFMSFEEDQNGYLVGYLTKTSSESSQKPLILDGLIVDGKIIIDGYTVDQLFEASISREIQIVISVGNTILLTARVMNGYVLGTVYAYDDITEIWDTTNCIINLEDRDNHIVGDIIFAKSAIDTDKKLTQSGAAADAEIVGQAFDEVRQEIAEIEEKIPSVSSWAKAETKPSYTPEEIGALPATTKIPTKVSELTNDSGFMTEYVETDPTVPAWAKKPEKPSYTPEEVGALPADTKIPTKVSELTNDRGYLTGYTETDPTVPAWAKKAEKPTYTPSEVGADAAGTASGMVSVHDTSETAHSDIRILISDISAQLKSLTESDDETLGKLQSLVAYIEENKSLIDSITVGKVNVADIVDNLTTSVTNKPLSANMGVRLKQLIDAIKVPTKTSELTNDSGYLTDHQDLSGYAKKTDIPTKISQLTNDSGYLTSHQDLSGYAKKTDIPTSLPASDVYNWAKAKTKPQYTASEVGALPVGTTIPSKTSDLTNDKGFITDYTETDPTVPSWAKQAQKPKYTASEVGALPSDTKIPTKVSELTNDKGYITGYTETDPTVPAWAKQAQKPKYTASEVGAASKTEFNALAAEVDDYPVSVKRYGAMADGSADCTSAMQSALAENRKVYIPGGTYKLSGELIIRDNCELVLAQDAVLNFTQSSGNCITLYRSASVVGNHATVNVVYAFTGKVINVDTTAHTNVKDVPPWIHWSPQWKTARYLRDLNICKPNKDGIHASDDGASNGTAVYICSNGNATAYFSWGTHFAGVKIAGAFEYGVRAINLGRGYLNEMRIEALIDAPKIGVSLEDCNNTYISAVVQPRKAENGAVYAKHGIQLIRSSNTDLSGARIWDWNSSNSLWTYDKDNVNQHFAMYGSCVGTIMNDFLYHQVPPGFNDIRELIYCDEEYKKVNFDSLVIIQEPVTKWFKSVDNEPYFAAGDTEERLLFKYELDALFQTKVTPTFENVLASAIDKTGNVYNGVGYNMNGYWEENGGPVIASDYYTNTGYIRCKEGDILRTKGFALKKADDICRIVFYDSSFNFLGCVKCNNIVNNASTYYLKDYTDIQDGFSIQIAFPRAVYITISTGNGYVGVTPIITINEEINYTHVGTMAEGVKVSENSLVGMEKYEQTGRKVTSVTSQSSDDEYPSAKAVYSALQSALGSYVNDIAALVGGDA